MVGVANGWAVVDGPAIWDPACCIDAPKGLIGGTEPGQEQKSSGGTGPSDHWLTAGSVASCCPVWVSVCAVSAAADVEAVAPVGLSLFA